MSPLALHEYACTQVPPWQLVEQQSVPTVQWFPSVMQLETVLFTCAQVPPLQFPEQHWEFPPQLLAFGVQLAAQAALTQEKLQQSVPSVQPLPDSRQNLAEVHFPKAQTLEQHCELEVQLSSPATHAGVYEIPHWLELHVPEQQSDGALQLVVSAWHWPAPSVQMPLAQ